MTPEEIAAEVETEIAKGETAWAVFMRKKQANGGLQPHEQPDDPYGRGDVLGEAGPLILTQEQFLATFNPPAYLLDGILQRGFLYSLTALTGHGKTALTMLLAHHIAQGKPLHGRDVLPGTVLFLAGENSDSIKARFLVQNDYFKVTPTDKIRFIDGRINIEELLPQLRAEAEAIDDLVLVIVDTATAYFPGDDVNNNAQQGAYARVLRQLTLLNGKPCVLANGHPVKRAMPDNLIPVGGGHFLNEVDGNLTAHANGEKQVTFHWQGKFRGPEFEPMAFDLVPASSPMVIDARGRVMPSVVAVPVADAAVEASEGKQEADENRILFALEENPRASFQVLATKAGILLENGTPHKSKMHRLLTRLAADKLVVKHRGRYMITEKGKHEIGRDDVAEPESSAKKQRKKTDKKSGTVVEP